MPSFITEKDPDKRNWLWLKMLLIGTVIGNKQDRWVKISSTRFRNQATQKVVKLADMKRDFWWVVSSPLSKYQQEEEEIEI